MEIIELENNYASFYLNNVSMVVCNELRKTLYSMIETMAIDLVDIRDNSSALLDRLMADRISLIPIRVDDLNKYNFSEDCDCEFYCEKCSVKLEMKIENTTNNYLAVTSKDLIPVNKDVHIYHGKTNEGILLTKLRSGQKIDLTCIARKDTAMNHQKWSPVCQVICRMEPVVTLKNNSSLSEKEKLDLVNICPTKVFTLNKDGQVDIEDMNRCIACRMCTNLNPEVVDLKLNPNRVFVSFETVGQLDPMDIIMMALRSLKKKITK